MTSGLENKRIVVTGASGTLGYAITTSLLEAGAHVHAVDVQLDSLAHLMDQWPTTLSVYMIDVTDETAVQSFATNIAGEAIHGLVNNVGSEGSGKPITDVPADEINSLFTVNVMSAFLMTRALAPFLVTSAPASIVNIASTSGLVGSANDVGYTTMKHAIVGFTRAIAAELGPNAVRANAVCPGPIESPLMTAFEMTQPDASTVRNWYERNTPAGRYGRPEEVSDLIAFLLSDQSQFITGTAIPVDGGLTSSGRI